MEIISGQEGVLGAEVRGVDLNGASAALAKEVLDAVHRHALVRF